MTAHANETAAVLDRLFHEPSRLAILSALCAARDGQTFTELRDACRLTDGNLNRHLNALEAEGVVRIHKAFVDDKPRTTIALTREGLNRFNLYLEKLAGVLEEARRVARSDRVRQTRSPRTGLAAAQA
jgi:DNA-binding transcriptional ArsR family regulator